MDLQVTRKFTKQAKELPLFTQVALKKLIIHIQEAESLSTLPNLKKLQGSGSFYRVRIGSYRIGLELIDSNIVVLKAAAHRRDIYKLFP